MPPERFFAKIDTADHLRPRLYFAIINAKIWARENMDHDPETFTFTKSVRLEDCDQPTEFFSKCHYLLKLKFCCNAGHIKHFFFKKKPR